MTIEVFARVDAFGSWDARRLAARWAKVVDDASEEHMSEADMMSLYSQMVNLARRELGGASLPPGLALESGPDLDLFASGDPGERSG
jgi:hypothetical protein